MWEFFKSVSLSTNSYTTVFGKCWYVINILLRLFVLVTIGKDVYSDERGKFKCNTSHKQSGCENLCFDQFVKMNHLRFWSFQLMFAIGPTILLHLYCDLVTKEDKKIKILEKNISEAQSENRKASWRNLLRKVRAKQKKLGPLEVKESAGVLLSSKVYWVYIFTLILRTIFEVVFIYLGFVLFSFKDGYLGVDAPNDQSLFAMYVPSVYHCHANEYSNYALFKACNSHFDGWGYDVKGKVKCWISRPMEKTYFLRYMNVLSFFSLLANVFELVYVAWKLMSLKKYQKSKQCQTDKEWITIEDVVNYEENTRKIE